MPSRRKKTSVKWKQVKNRDIDELLDELSIRDFGPTAKGAELQERFNNYIRQLGHLRIKARETLEVDYHIQVAVEEYTEALNKYERCGNETYRALVRLFQEETSASKVLLQKLRNLIETEARFKTKKAGLSGTIESLYSITVQEQRAAIKQLVRETYDK